MVEAANGTREAQRASKAPQPSESAHSRASALLRAFEKEKGRDASPAQISDAETALKRMDAIRSWIHGRLNTLAFYDQTKYDLSSEKTRMCFALYVLKTVSEIGKAAKINGDSASYSLFLSTAIVAHQALSPDLFLDDRGWELAMRFERIKPNLDACASVFQTPSLTLQEVQDTFGFQLTGMVNERRKSGLMV